MAKTPRSSHGHNRELPHTLETQGPLDSMTERIPMKRRMGAVFIALLMALMLSPASPASAASPAGKYDNSWAPKEPECKWYIKNSCEMRKVYRNVFYETSTLNQGKMRASVLVATAPMKNDSKVRASSANVVYDLTTRNLTPGQKRCIRESTLKAIRQQAKVNGQTIRVSHTFAVAEKALGIASKDLVAKRIGQNSADYFNWGMSKYFGLSADAAKASGKIVATNNTRWAMYDAMVCS